MAIQSDKTNVKYNFIFTIKNIHVGLSYKVRKLSVFFISFIVLDPEYIFTVLT